MRSGMPVDEETLLSALKLQRDWGVTAVLGQVPLNHLASPAQEFLRESAVSGPKSLSLSGETGSSAFQSQGAERYAAAPAGENYDALFRGITDVQALFQTAIEHGAEELAVAVRQTVSPVFVPGSSLFFIGEVPDMEEDRTGVPFTGPRGGFMAQMCQSIGLKMTDFSRATAIPWRPPGNRPPGRMEMALCRALLRRIAVLSGARRIVAMWPLAVDFLLDDAERKNGDLHLPSLRGVWHPAALSMESEAAGSGLSERDESATVLPFLGFSQIWSSGEARRMAWEDLLFLRRSLLGQ